jgi:hypothetical protein
VWNTLSQMGECARDEAQWLPSALPLWELYSFRSCKCLEPWLKRQKYTKLGLQDIIKKDLKCRWLKCPHIVHLNLICMSYDPRKDGSQIGNLTPDHNSLENKDQMRCNWGVLYTVGKIFLRVITYLSFFI